MERLPRYCDLLPGVLHDLIGFIRRSRANTVVLADENDAKAAVLQHAGKLSFALADRQGLRLCRPNEVGSLRTRPFRSCSCRFRLRRE